MKRQLLAGLTALSMLCSAVPVTIAETAGIVAQAAATSGTCGDNLTWKLDDAGTLSISGTGDMYDYDQNTGFPLFTTPWAEAAVFGKVKAIVLEPGITSFGNYAFAMCDATEITIPNGVTKLGSCSLWSNEMSTIEIPDSVTQIADGVFTMCDNLTSVEIPDSVATIDANAFFCCAALETVTILNPKCEIYSSGKTICNSLENNTPIYTGTIKGYDDSTAESYAALYGYKFESLGAAPVNPNEEFMKINADGVLYSAEGCKGDVVIPKGVTKISSAFFNNTEITSITLPSSLKEIGWGAFYGCTGLKSVTIPDGVTDIGAQAFYGCSNLNEVHIPESVAYIGQNAFQGTPWLDEMLKQQTGDFFIINDIILSVAWNANTIEKKDFVIPDGVKDMAPELFWSDYSITNVTFPASLEHIRENALNCCVSLKTVTILNPDCEIYDSTATICNNIKDWEAMDTEYVFTGTIKGYDGSTAEAYAKKYNYKFVSLGASPEKPALSLGDVNGDKSVNATDAAQVLIAAAKIGAGSDSGLTEEQKAVANVNGDEAINASDAASILTYAAMVGAGKNITFEDFLDSKNYEQELQGYVDAVIRIVNSERQKAGRKPLYAAPALNEAAQVRAEELPLAFNAQHTRPDGRECYTVLTDLSIPFGTCGENIAMDYKTPDDVMDAWMHSEGHKANILETDFEYIGVGVAEVNGVLYWTQVFTGGKALSGTYLPE